MQRDSSSDDDDDALQWGFQDKPGVDLAMAQAAVQDGGTRTRPLRLGSLMEIENPLYDANTDEILAETAKSFYPQGLPGAAAPKQPLVRPPSVNHVILDLETNGSRVQSQGQAPVRRQPTGSKTESAKTAVGKQPASTQAFPQLVNAALAKIKAPRIEDPLSPGEEPRLPKRACFFQAICLLVFVALATFATLGVQWRNRLLGANVYSGSRGLNMTVDNCRVDFLAVTTSRHLTISYSIGGADSSRAALEDFGGDLNLHFLGSQSGNLAGIAVDCSVIFAVGTDFEFTQMNLIIAGERESTISATSLTVNGTINITGTALNLRTRALTTETLFVNLASGVVDLGDIKILDPQIGIDASIVDGDIIIGPRDTLEADLAWNQPCGYVCLPAGYFVDDTHCVSNVTGETEFDLNIQNVSDLADTNSTGNGSTVVATAAIRQCQSRDCAGNVYGIRFLLDNASMTELFGSDSFSNEFSDTYSAFPLQIRASAQLGSIYIYDKNRVIFASPLLPVNGTNSTALNTTSNDTLRFLEPRLDDILAFKMLTLFTSMNENDDGLFRIILRTFLPDTLWLPCTRKVYLEVEPGFLSTFSATLLKPNAGQYRGNLYPGICPYQPQPPVQVRGRVDQLLKSSVDKFGSSNLHTMGHMTSNGMLRYTEDEPGTYGQQSVDIDQNIALLLAIIFSLILAGIAGIALSIAGILALKMGLIEFQKSILLENRVSDFKKELEYNDEHNSTDETKPVSSAAGASEAPSEIEVAMGNPFDVMDIFIKWYQNSRVNSLIEFCKEYYKENHEHYAQPLSAVESAYEDFCSEHHYKQLSIEKNAAIFAQHGVYRELRTDNSTETYTNLIWKMPKELEAFAEGEDDNVLEMFLDYACKPSPFDYDFVYVAEFKVRYQSFIADHDLFEMPVLPRDMLQLGYPFVRKTMVFMVQSQAVKKAQGRRERLRLWLAGVWLRLKNSWLIVSLVTVFVHVFISAIIPVPLLAVAFLFQHEAKELALVSDRYFLLDDALLGPFPDTLDWSTGFIAWQNQIIFYATLLFYVVSIVELILHYVDQTLPKKETKKKLQDEKKTAIDNKSGKLDAAGLKGKRRKQKQERVSIKVLLYRVLRASFQIVYYVFLLLFVSGLLGYVGLVLVWAILGAIINPFKFLPYAAGAITLIAVTLTKAKELKNAQQHFKDKIVHIIKKQSEAALMAVRAKMNKAAGAGQLSQSGGGFGDMAERVSRASNGLDPTMLSALAKGDPGAVREFAIKMGVEPGIALILVAVARQDVDRLQDAVRDLAPKVGLDGELAAAVAILACDSSPEAGKRAIKVFMNTFADMIQSGKIPIPGANLPKEISAGIGQFDFDIKTMLMDESTLKELGLNLAIYMEDPLELKKALLDLAAKGNALAKRKIEQLKAEWKTKGLQTTSKAVGAALNQIPGLPKELRITLRHLPEVAEALLAVVETADFGPVLQLFVVEKELAELFPFPIELFTMAHALIQKDKDMLILEAQKLFMYLLGKTDLYDKFRQGGFDAMKQKAIADANSTVSSAVDVAAKHIQDGAAMIEGAATGFVTDATESLRDVLPSEVTTFMALTALVAGDAQALNEVLRFAGKGKGNPFMMDHRVAQAVLLLVTEQEGGPNANPQIARFAVLKSKIRKKLADAGDDATARVDKYTKMANTALAKSKKTTGQVARGLAATGKTEVGKIAGALQGAKNQLAITGGLSLKHSCIQPLNEQLKLEDTNLLGGLLALTRGLQVDFYALIRMAQLPSKHGANGVAALLSGDSYNLELKMANMCNKLKMEPALIAGLVKLRKEQYGGSLQFFNNVLPKFGFHTVDHAKADQFSDTIRAFTALAAATDPQVLQSAIASLALRPGSSATPTDVNSPTWIAKRVELATAVANARKTLSQLSDSELIELGQFMGLTFSEARPTSDHKVTFTVDHVRALLQLRLVDEHDPDRLVAEVVQYFSTCGRKQEAVLDIIAALRTSTNMTRLVKMFKKLGKHDEAVLLNSIAMKHLMALRQNMRLPLLEEDTDHHSEDHGPAIQNTIHVWRRHLGLPSLGQPTTSEEGGTNISGLLAVLRLDFSTKELSAGARSEKGNSDQKSKQSQFIDLMKRDVLPGFPATAVREDSLEMLNHLITLIASPVKTTNQKQEIRVAARALGARLSLIPEALLLIMQLADPKKVASDQKVKVAAQLMQRSLAIDAGPIARWTALANSCTEDVSFTNTCIVNLADRDRLGVPLAWLQAMCTVGNLEEYNNLAREAIREMMLLPNTGEQTKLLVEGALALGTLNVGAIKSFAREYGLQKNSFHIEKEGPGLKLTCLYALRTMHLLTDPDPDDDMQTAFQLTARLLQVPEDILRAVALLVTVPQLTPSLQPALRLMAQNLELPPVFIEALIAQKRGDHEQLSQALLKIATEEAKMTPVVAAGLVSIGSGEVSGIEGICDAVLLDVDPFAAEGLVALSGGAPPSIRACLPKLASMLELNGEIVAGLISIVNRDSSGVSELCALLNMKASKNKFKAILNLFSRNQSTVIDGLVTLQQTANITIGSPEQASAVVSLINGNTQAPARYFSDSIQNLDLAVTLLYMMRMPTGDDANLENYLRSPLPGLFLRLQPALMVKRDISGTSARLSHAGDILTAVFYAGAAYETQGLEDLEQNMNGTIDVQSLINFFEQSSEQLSRKHSKVDPLSKVLQAIKMKLASGATADDEQNDNGAEAGDDQDGLDDDDQQGTGSKAKRQTAGAEDVFLKILTPHDQWRQITHDPTATKSVQYRRRLSAILKALFSLGRKLQELDKSTKPGVYFAASEKLDREDFGALKIPKLMHPVMERALTFVILTQQKPSADIFDNAEEITFDAFKFKADSESQLDKETRKVMVQSGEKVLDYFLQATVNASLENAGLARMVFPLLYNDPALDNGAFSSKLCMPKCTEKLGLRSDLAFTLLALARNDGSKIREMVDLKDLFAALNVKPESHKRLFDLIQIAIGNMDCLTEIAAALSMSVTNASAFAVGSLLLETDPNSRPKTQQIKKILQPVLEELELGNKLDLSTALVCAASGNKFGLQDLIIELTCSAPQSEAKGTMIETLVAIVNGDVAVLHQIYDSDVSDEPDEKPRPKNETRVEYLDYFVFDLVEELCEDGKDPDHLCNIFKGLVALMMNDNTPEALDGVPLRIPAYRGLAHAIGINEAFIKGVVALATKSMDAVKQYCGTDTLFFNFGTAKEDCEHDKNVRDKLELVILALNGRERQRKEALAKLLELLQPDHGKLPTVIQRISSDDLSWTAELDYSLLFKKLGVTDPLTIRCLYSLVVLDLETLEKKVTDGCDDSPGDLLFFQQGDAGQKSRILTSLLAIIRRDFSAFKSEVYDSQVARIERALRCLVPQETIRKLIAVITAVFLFPDKSILVDLFMIVIEQAVDLLPPRFKDSIRKIISFGKEALKAIQSAKATAKMVLETAEGAHSMMVAARVDISTILQQIQQVMESGGFLEVFVEAFKLYKGKITEEQVNGLVSQVMVAAEAKFNELGLGESSEQFFEVQMQAAAIFAQTAFKEMFSLVATIPHIEDFLDIVAMEYEIQVALINILNGSPGAAIQLAAKLGLKFGLDKRLVNGVLAIAQGNFTEKTIRELAPLLSGVSEEAAQVADILAGLIGLARSDLSSAKPLAMRLGSFDEKQFDELLSAIKKLQPHLKQAMPKPKKKAGMNFDDESLSPAKLFAKFDVDRSGSIDFHEFYELLKYLNYPKRMTESKAMKIFVKADRSKTKVLTLMEFEQAIVFHQEGQSNKVLDLLGLSAGQLARILAGVLFVLLLLFVFIFMGIVAFTTPGGFTASVNSLLPIVAGGGSSQGNGAPTDDDASDDLLNDKLDEMMSVESVHE